MLIAWEALIGMMFDRGGFPAALRTAAWLGIEMAGKAAALLTGDRKELKETGTVAPPVQQELRGRDKERVEQLQERIGYQFKHPILALQALTHPSHAATGDELATNSYQRLEFLGDALLDLIVTE